MYEILEDYQSASTPREQEEIFASFCSLIWNNPNQRILTEKHIQFNLRPELRSTEIGQIFQNYTSISYQFCPASTEDTDFASLIRQKVNNIYTYLFDDQVCTRKAYLDLLRVPKQLYHQWEAALRPSRKSADGADASGSLTPSLNQTASGSLTPRELSDTLQAAMRQAAALKETYGKQKMKLDWEDYQQVVEGFFRKLFQNYAPLEGYPDNACLTHHVGAWHEDNFCISYFCNGLNGYFKNYQKKYYGLYNISSRRKLPYGRCSCGNLFQQNKQHNRRLCDTCRNSSRLEKYRRYNQKRTAAGKKESIPLPPS